MPHPIPALLATAADLAPVIRRFAVGPLLVGLDFDGTLAPIVDRPEDARLDPAMLDRLHRLAAVAPTAVVSGRDLDILRDRITVPGITLVGSHGLEIAHPNATVERAAGLDRSDADLAALVDRLRRDTEGLPGVLVEPKRHSVAVHWRLATPAGQTESERLIRAAARDVPSFKIVTGKMVAELRPSIERDKGGAIDLLRAAAITGGAGPAVLYIGDDVTDEDAFRVLDPARDLGLLVASSPRPSAAAWRLPGIEAVADCLDLLIAARTATGGPTP